MSNNDTCASDPTLERLFRAHRGAVTGLSFSPDSTQLVSGSADASVMLWSFKKKARAFKYEGHQDDVTGVHFLEPRGKTFASCSKDKNVRLWKPSIKIVTKEFRVHTSAVLSIHGSPDSDALITASADKHIKMWNVAQQIFLGTFRGHNNWVNCARFSWNGRLVTSCSEDKTVKLWDRGSNTCIHTYHEDGSPKYVEFHPNDKCIGVAVNNSIKIYDIRSHGLIQLYNKVHAKAVNQLSFHPSGLFLVSGSSDGTSKVFDIIEGRTIYTLEGHDGAVTTVAFSPDGLLFATGGHDKRVLVWKSNFYVQEKLARPLKVENVDVTSNTTYTETNGHIEETTRRVDARKSFSQMELSDVAEESNLSSDVYFEDARSSPSLNLGESAHESRLPLTPTTTPLAGGDHDRDADVTFITNTLANLKTDVLRMQSQLSDVLILIETLEKRNSALNKS